MFGKLFTEAVFNIVLVEPEIPANTGNIARTCLATDAHLHLVKPLGFSLDNRQLKRAGMDYWHEVRVTTWDSVEFSLHLQKKPRAVFSSLQNANALITRKLSNPAIGFSLDVKQKACPKHCWQRIASIC